MKIQLIAANGDRLGTAKVRRQTPMPEVLTFSTPPRVFKHVDEKCSERICFYQQVTTASLRSIHTSTMQRQSWL